MKPTFCSHIPALTLAALALVLLASANTIAVPELRTEAGPNWLKRHDFFVDIANHETGCQLLFLGDSITDFWRERALGIWGKNYGPNAAENFGISGDRTQHLLWRLQNGEIGNLRPKAIVLMIGTNNTGYEPGKQTKRNTPRRNRRRRESRRRLPARKTPRHKNPPSRRLSPQ